MGRVPEIALTLTSPAVLAASLPASEATAAASPARIPAILQIHQARAWETLPGIFHRFEKQDEGAKKNLFETERKSLKALLPKGKLGPHACVCTSPSRVPPALGPPPGSARRLSPGLCCPARPMATRHARAWSPNLSGAPALHLPPGRCRFPSLFRGTDFLERRGRVGPWRAGRGGGCCADLPGTLGTAHRRLPDERRRSHPRP